MSVFIYMQTFRIYKEDRKNSSNHESKLTPINARWEIRDQATTILAYPLEHNSSLVIRIVNNTYNIDTAAAVIRLAYCTSQDAVGL